MFEWHHHRENTYKYQVFPFSTNTPRVISMWEKYDLFSLVMIKVSAMCQLMCSLQCWAESLAVQIRIDSYLDLPIMQFYLIDLEGKVLSSDLIWLGRKHVIWFDWFGQVYDLIWILSNQFKSLLCFMSLSLCIIGVVCWPVF